MRSTNPTFNERLFSKLEHVSSSHQMTLDGTINKSLITLLLVVVSAAYVWNLFLSGGYAAVSTIMIVSAVLGFVVALATIFVPKWSPVTTPLYALIEGGFIGGISALLETAFPGIVLQAIALTFGVLLMMLYLYKARIIKVTEKLRMGIFMALGAVVLVYLVTMIMGFFGTTIPYIHQGGTIGIIFSLVVVGIASFSLLLDFDFIEKGSKRNLPKYMEWYGAFGLLVTLVWLYIEILQLLAKMRSD